MFIQSRQTGQLEGELLFKPVRLLRAYSFNPDREYAIDDFRLEGRTIIYTGGGPLPHLKADDLLSPVETPDHGQPHADGNHYILYGGHELFADRQVHFDYLSEEAWDGPAPKEQKDRLPLLQHKLASGAPIVVTILGDSISQGCDSTAWGNVPPKLPPYRDLLVRAIREASGGAVKQYNLAVGGKTAAWATTQIEAVAATKPDLVVLAFGMNDSSGRRSVADFTADITAVVDGVRKLSPQTEFLLVSGITPIPQWAKSHPGLLAAYDTALRAMAGEHIAFGDVRSVWIYLLSRKNYYDLSGNGINHPNDYGHRLYGDVLARTILGEHPGAGNNHEVR
jgi:lysophospholipase L1-like esterase